MLLRHRCAIVDLGLMAQFHTTESHQFPSEGAQCMSPRSRRNHVMEGAGTLHHVSCADLFHSHEGVCAIWWLVDYARLRRPTEAMLILQILLVSIVPAAWHDSAPTLVWEPRATPYAFRRNSEFCYGFKNCVGLSWLFGFGSPSSSSPKSVQKETDGRSGVHRGTCSCEGDTSNPWCH